MKRHNLKFAGIAYHLWHHEAERDALPQNDALLKATLSEQKNPAATRHGRVYKITRFTCVSPSNVV